MKLIGVKHRSGASLQITHGGTLLGNDQRAFELARVAGVDPEVGGEFHRALNTLGDEHKGAVAEHG